MTTGGRNYRLGDRNPYSQGSLGRIRLCPMKRQIYRCPSYTNLLDGVVQEIVYSGVTGRAPLDTNELRFFQEIVTAKENEIVAKWIDFFVLHKSIMSERITRRLK